MFDMVQLRPIVPGRIAILELSNTDGCSLRFVGVHLQPEWTPRRKINELNFVHSDEPRINMLTGEVVRSADNAGKLFETEFPFLTELWQPRFTRVSGSQTSSRIDRVNTNIHAVEVADWETSCKTIWTKCFNTASDHVPVCVAVASARKHGEFYPNIPTWVAKDPKFAETVLKELRPRSSCSGCGTVQGVKHLSPAERLSDLKESFALAAVQIKRSSRPQLALSAHEKLDWATLAIRNLNSKRWQCVARAIDAYEHLAQFFPCEMWTEHGVFQLHNSRAVDSVDIEGPDSVKHNDLCEHARLLNSEAVDLRIVELKDTGNCNTDRRNEEAKLRNLQNFRQRWQPSRRRAVSTIIVSTIAAVSTTTTHGTGGTPGRKCV